MTGTRRLRCRYQVPNGGRSVGFHQCLAAAKDTRQLTVRAHRVDGQLIHQTIQLLPVCGSHRNVVDRDPRTGAHSAYTWSEGDGVWSPREQEYVR